MPTVSIILPTYNRSAFLDQAFTSIRSQTYTDWELVVVDDGSTDNTPDLVKALAGSIGAQVRYFHQANQGAYAARNTGLDHARGRLIAFFDSDDIWLPHHLTDCVEALEQNSDVDWVYGACRIVNLETGQVEATSTFHEDGRPRPFLRLRTRGSDRLRIIEDPRASTCLITHGFYCGLQNSVLRRSIFERLRFSTAYHNEAEDRVMVLRAFKAGHRFAYFDNVHVVYHVHAANSSSAAWGGSLERNVRLSEALIRGYEDARQELALSRPESRALDRKLGREYFWHLGYALFWEHGRRREALEAFRKGIGYWPWSILFWKTYLLAALRAR